MKDRILCVIILLFLINSVEAQVSNAKESKPHRFFIGGNTSIIIKDIYVDRDYDEIDMKSVNIEFVPKFGFFINPKIAIGFEYGLTYMEYTPIHYYRYYYEQFQEVMIRYGNLMHFALFLRYQNTLIGKLKYYIEPIFGAERSIYLKGYYTDYYDTWYHTMKNYNKYFGSLNCGFLYSFSKNIAFEIQVLGINYSEMKIENTDKKFSEFTIEYIFSNPNIGLVFYLK